MSRTEGRSKPPVNIETTIHKKDKRKNIPTKELSGFVKADEDKPKIIRYPRDTSLDPQLVWKGKDEQDSKDLEVPAVPVYIQEKIHPKYIIEDIRAQAKKEKPEPQMQLFADFDGIQFEDLIEFYQHDQNWTNRMILGDSLLVMTSLAEKEGLKGKVQMIYIDPPYGIGFSSNWQVSTRSRDVKDGKAVDTTRQPEQIKAFRDTWKLGIHSYIAYLRDRLVVARDLLTETGSIFIQIGDENVHLVRCLLDEVFGRDNFCGQISFKTAAGQPSTLLAALYDHLLWYAKDRTLVKYRDLYHERDLYEKTGTFSWIELPDNTLRRLTAKERTGQVAIPTGKLFKDADLTVTIKPGEKQSNVFFNSKEFSLPNNLRYTDGIEKLIAGDRIVVINERLCGKRYESDNPVVKFANVWDDTMLGTFQLTKEPKVYVVQTATKVIERCVLISTDPGDLVLDPTCGSGTTAYVAEQWGRRWITIDTSRVALALARTRLMSARFSYYLLADSAEGVKKESELTGRTPPDYKTGGDIKKGFVYKRVPHMTLKAIANNPDIKEGMTREQIDAAIARYTETETLYDQPYEDNRHIRVTGPLTVESLSPHRVIATGEERPTAEVEAQKEAGVGQFETMILDNLKKAGVQNTIKNERLKFDRLEPYAGEWLHAEGEYTEKDGTTRRVAVCIGP